MRPVSRGTGLSDLCSQTVIGIRLIFSYLEIVQNMSVKLLHHALEKISYIRLGVSYQE